MTSALWIDGSLIWGLKCHILPGDAAGVRYRLAFVRRGEEQPAVLYDNHLPKGHHRHVEGVEEPYDFVDVEQLLADFTADVQRTMGDDRWPRR